MIGQLLKVKHPEKVSAYFVNYICQHVRFILSSPGARASHHRTMDLLISTQQVHPVHFLLRFSVLCYVFEFNLWAAFPTEKQILIWEYYWLVWLDGCLNKLQSEVCNNLHIFVMITLHVSATLYFSLLTGSSWREVVCQNIDIE